MLYLFIGALLIISGKATSCTSSSECTVFSSDKVCNTEEGECTECLTDSDCANNDWHSDRGYLSCKPDILGDYGECYAAEDTPSPTDATPAPTDDTDTDTDTDTTSDQCTVDSDCTTAFGDGATCVDATTNYCLRNAATCSTNDDCIAAICVDSAYYSYCQEIVCFSDSACDLQLSGDFNCSGSITSAGECYQSCSSDSDCGITGYSCDSSKCEYSGNTSNSGIDRLTIFMAMIIMISSGLFI